MEKIQHSPGPWELKATYSENEQTGLIISGDTHSVCDTGVAYWYNRRAQGLDPNITNPIIARANANARLISAAPEMLEALKLCWEQLSLYVDASEQSPEDKEALDKACAAITKAESL